MTRLVVAPFLVAGVFLMIGWRHLIANVVVVEAAMPVGITASVMAKAYGADAEFAASATLWTTLGAAVTSPLAVFLFTSWG
jgi:predicted permease